MDPTTRAPFWADDFDMDLLRLVPELPELLGPVGQRVLYVRGGTSYGRLNHPAAWPSDGGSMVAFFGHRGPTEPEGFCAGQSVVACTAEEALRDAWAHSLRVVVDGVGVFDGGAFDGAFQGWMYAVRGHEHCDAPEDVARTRARLVEALAAARRALESVPSPEAPALRVSTARLGTKGLLNALDITRKSGSGDGLAFAPSWEILRPVLTAREEAERLRRAMDGRGASRVEDEAWRVYRPRFVEEMRASYTYDRGPWERLLARGHAVLLCYCTNPERCHRTILAREILPKLGAVYGYEVR